MKKDWKLKIEKGSISIRDKAGWLLWSSWPDYKKEFSVKDMMKAVRAAAKKWEGVLPVYMETSAR